MENKRQVYLLDPRCYSPETIAVTFAKTSRSPESFQQIASELNETKSSEFNEKWVVGYGHSSVAEHAVLHVAVENISRLACECLESNRLASYTEKSTRYQTWNADAFHLPAELDASPLQQEFSETCTHLLDTYRAIIPAVIQFLGRENPQQPNESTSAWERRIRSQTIDNCRFLLPSAVLANVGVTINARALEHALVKMLSHPLAEVRQMGAEIKACAIESVPTLLKYAEADETLGAAPDFSLPTPAFPAADETWCTLVASAADAEDRLLAAYVYRESQLNYAQSLAFVRQSGRKEKEQLATRLLNAQNAHASPLRELEHTVFTFAVTLDQGAYYEVKRHRMLTLTPQPLTARLGYALPRAVSAAGQEEIYCAAMGEAQSLYERLAQFSPEVAAYIVPNAFNRRFLITANLRSLYHFIQLRSAPNAHFSVRRLAQAMSAQLAQALPLFASGLPTNRQESVASLEEAFFAETAKK